MTSYILPTSVTWWTGIAMIVAGAFSVFNTGDTTLLLAGLGFIGVRAKLERAEPGA